MRSRDLIGRTIVGVELNRFHTGRSFGPWSYDPVFILDNGRRIYFIVDEVEDASTYGVRPVLTDLPARQAKKEAA